MFKMPIHSSNTQSSPLQHVYTDSFHGFLVIKRGVAQDLLLFYWILSVALALRCRTEMEVMGVDIRAASRPVRESFSAGYSQLKLF